MFWLLPVFLGSTCISDLTFIQKYGRLTPGGLFLFFSLCPSAITALCGCIIWNAPSDNIFLKIKIWARHSIHDALQRAFSLALWASFGQSSHYSSTQKFISGISSGALVSSSQISTRHLCDTQNIGMKSLYARQHQWPSHRKLPLPDSYL